MKFLYVSCNEIILYLPGKAPFTLWSGKGKALDLLGEFLSVPELGDSEPTEVSLDLPPETTADAQCPELLLSYANLCM